MKLEIHCTVDFSVSWTTDVDVDLLFRNSHVQLPTTDKIKLLKFSHLICVDHTLVKSERRESTDTLIRAVITIRKPTIPAPTSDSLWFLKKIWKVWDILFVVRFIWIGKFSQKLLTLFLQILDLFRENLEVFRKSKTNLEIRYQLGNWKTWEVQFLET